MIHSGSVDVIVSISSNFFFTVTLPCTLWFLDKGKVEDEEIGDQVLFIDARKIYRQIDRAHREFTDEQVEFLADIVRLYRGEEIETLHRSKEIVAKSFPDGVYADVPGLCAVATIDEIEAQGWSLNPGRYVGVADGPQEDIDFVERLEELSEEFETLNTDASKLQEEINSNISLLLSPEAR